MYQDGMEDPVCSLPNNSHSPFSSWLKEPPNLDLNPVPGGWIKIVFRPSWLSCTTLLPKSPLHASKSSHVISSGQMKQKGKSCEKLFPHWWKNILPKPLAFDYCCDARSHSRYFWTCDDKHKSKKPQAENERTERGEEPGMVMALWNNVQIS